MKAVKLLDFISPHLDKFNPFVARLASLRYLVQSHFWLLPHSFISLPEPGISCVLPNIERPAYKEKQ